MNDSVVRGDNEAAAIGTLERGNDSLQATDLEDRHPPVDERTSALSYGEGMDLQHAKKADDGLDTDPIAGQEIITQYTVVSRSLSLAS